MYRECAGVDVPMPVPVLVVDVEGECKGKTGISRWRGMLDRRVEGNTSQVFRMLCAKEEGCNLSRVQKEKKVYKSERVC